jgi:phytoene dehydrogenase-like protein
MPDIKKDDSIIIIGAGFAGLAAGIYARMNGYKTQIFEMHDKPGGLCTSWERKGYTIDGCIHWLVGSSPQSSIHDYWEEAGVSQGREFIYMDEYMHFETSDGRTITFYSDIDRLEKHLLEFAPEDKKPISDFIEGVRICLKFDMPPESAPFLNRMKKRIGLMWTFVTKGKKINEWMKVTGKEFASRFSNPLLRSAFEEIWIPEFSIAFMFFTFAYLHNRNAGYPLGGSLPMSKALEERYKTLGGTIHYKKRVEKIITEGNTATGIILADGTELRASRIISAADGYTTIFKMLEGKYADESIRNMYDKWIPFYPLIFVGLGVNRTFPDVPKSVSGFSFPLKEQVKIGNKTRDRLSVHLFNHDPSLSPEGKTSIILMFETNYEYWKKLHENRKEYDREKETIAKTVIELL